MYQGFFDWADGQFYERTIYPLIINNFAIVTSGIWTQEN